MLFPLWCPEKLPEPPIRAHVPRVSIAPILLTFVALCQILWIMGESFPMVGRAPEPLALFAAADGLVRATGTGKERLLAVWTMAKGHTHRIRRSISGFSAAMYPDQHGRGHLAGARSGLLGMMDFAPNSTIAAGHKPSRELASEPVRQPASIRCQDRQIPLARFNLASRFSLCPGCCGL
jgi:hypothetical protein